MGQTIDTEQHVGLDSFVGALHVYRQPEVGHRRARQFDAYDLAAGIEICHAAGSYGKKVCCDLRVKKIRCQGIGSRRQRSLFAESGRARSEYSWMLILIFLLVR